MDGQNWTEVDRQTNVKKTRGGRDIIEIKVAGAPQARFVRLTQTGPNDEGSHVMDLWDLKLFGPVLEYRE
jgi:hypothetical protein